MNATKNGHVKAQRHYRPSLPHAKHLFFFLNPRFFDQVMSCVVCERAHCFFKICRLRSLECFASHSFSLDVVRFCWHISCFCIRLCLNWYWFNFAWGRRFMRLVLFCIVETLYFNSPWSRSAIDSAQNDHANVVHAMLANKEVMGLRCCKM